MRSGVVDRTSSRSAPRPKTHALVPVGSGTVLVATALALGAAVFHATWNLILKTSDDRVGAALALWVLGGVVALPVLAFTGLPDTGSWPFLLAGAFIQVLYVYGLSKAYTIGDFSLTYPMARGTGALGVALGGTLLLGDHLAPVAWVGITVVAVSLAMLMGRGASWVSVGWAAATGLFITTYQLIDAAGSRRAGSSLAYGLAVSAAVGVWVTVAGILRGDGHLMVHTIRHEFLRLGAAALLMTPAYTMVIVAYRHGPVGYVSVLRESSVVLGAVLGWIFLRETMGRWRVASAVVMVAGMALVIVGG